MPTLRLERDGVVLTFATDIHLAALPPGRRRGTYRDQIIQKIHQWANLTQELRGVGMCGGDVFHVKLPTSPSNSFGVVNDAIHAFGSFPMGCVLGVVGNHDVTGDNLGTLPDQPLGILMSSGTYQPVGCYDGDPMIIESADGVRVRVDTFDWMPGPDLLATLQAKVRLQGDRPWDFRVAVVHAFQQPGASGAIYKDYMLGHDDLQGTDYDVFCYGHDHSRKGVVGTGPGPYHVQLGSLARAAHSHDEINRDVSIAAMTFRRGRAPEITEYPLTVSPLELAFHTADLAVTQADTRDDVRRFFQGLEQQAKDVQATDPVEILEQLTQDPAIIQTISEVCELGPSPNAENPAND